MAEAPVALVTGASSGIGQAVAARLIGGGWQVIGVSRRRPVLPGPGCRWIEADLADPAAAADVAARAGRLDAVVHAAGLQFSAPLGGLDHDHGELMWRLHVDVPTRLIDAAVQQLTDGARIVLIGSRTSSGVAGKSQYAATKAALMGMGRTWAQELAPRGITVNVLSPGPTDTPMLADPGRAATPAKLPALGRLVDPEDVAALAGFLLGPHGKSITGQNYVICGGASL